ncbi:hypothetical protein, unknown function [Leishmania tarentolae]|uniref:Uncharacterized protein n=1 Tax=Leishmania tarentolae TaxID=5689 RepID=A0A640KLW4_LEITA|nr:hypothetical protein, unknown function [Leishmania tarentolae]
MRQRGSSPTSALAVTGRGLSENAMHSKLAMVAPTAATGSPDGGPAAEEKSRQTHKQSLLAKKAASNCLCSDQQGRPLARESKTIAQTMTTFGSCHAAEHQLHSHSLQPSVDTVLEVSLVQNLKKQISCLEAQLHVIKQQQASVARTHRHSNAASHEESARAAVTAAAARLSGVELTLPHAERVRHADAAAAIVNTSEIDDVAMGRMREIPAAYQTERSALLHNIESLTKDVEGLQSLVLHLRRERDLMVAEMVDFRTALREAKVENESMSAKCAATHLLLEKEQALRRAAEENVRQCTTAASLHRSNMTVADALSQLDYYKLQAERTAEALTLERGRAHTLADALQRERDSAKTLEVQLCGLLDRISQMKRREDELALYYQQLGGRFVTVSAMLRHVLDVVPQERLQQQRAPSPKGAPAGSPHATEMTMSELRDTLDAWHREAAVEAAKAQHQTETMSDDVMTLLEVATETTTTVTSGLDNGLPGVGGEETTVTSPTRFITAKATVMSKESAINDDVLPITQTFKEAPPSLPGEAGTPVEHLLPAVPMTTAGAGATESSTCRDEKAYKGVSADAVSLVQRCEVSDTTTMSPSAAPQEALMAADAQTFNSSTLTHAVVADDLARPPADEETAAVNVAVHSVKPLESEETAKRTADNCVAAPNVVSTVVNTTGEASSFSGDALVVPPAAHVDKDVDPVTVISSTAPSREDEGAQPSHLPPPLTPTAIAAPAEAQALASEGNTEKENDVPPPPVFAVPHPLPSNLVSVPLPPASVPLPPDAISASVPPAPPAPPSLQQQLGVLNARIDAQEGVLTEMVRLHGGLLRSADA